MFAASNSNTLFSPTFSHPLQFLQSVHTPRNKKISVLTHEALRKQTKLHNSQRYLYISVYHFRLCYLIMCYSVGIYRHKQLAHYSGVFIVYLATRHVSAPYLAIFSLKMAK
jgi:hypothetical protein